MNRSEAAHVGSTAMVWEPKKRKWGRDSFPLRLGMCFLLVMMATIASGPENESRSIWIVNGLILSYLLLARRRRWGWYLAVGFAAQVTGAMFANSRGLAVGSTLAALNVAESGLAALLLRRRKVESPNFTDLHYLIRFLLCASVAAPAVIGAVFALIAHSWMGLPVGSQFQEWFATDALGMAITPTAFIAILRMQRGTAARLRSGIYFPLILAIVTPILLRQTEAPAMAVILPLLIVIQLRLGLGWASISTLYVAAVGGLIAVHWGGLANLIVAGSSLSAGYRLQICVASAMLTLYLISVVMERRRAAETKLREIAYLHQLVTDNSRDIIIIADFEGTRSYVSAAGTSWGGWGRDDLLRMKSMELLHPEDRIRVAGFLRQMLRGGDGDVFEARARNASGEYVWVEASLRTIRDTVTQKPTGILNMVRDISERKRAEQSRDFHQSLLTAIHGVSLDGVLVVDENGDVVSYNTRLFDVWNISPTLTQHLGAPNRKMADNVLLSQCLGLVKHPEAFVARVQELYANPEAKDECEVELRDGRTLERYSTVLRTGAGEYLGRVWFFRDITERKKAEQELHLAYRKVEELAVLDPLTGLANRRRFDEYFDTEWRRAVRDKQPLSMILVDVDLFKLYNDTYGHVQGDTCLREIAERMAGVVTRPGDLVARFGGEEFAVVLPNTECLGAMMIAQQMADAVKSRFLVHAASPHLVVTISAGYGTMIPQAALGTTHLLELADRALYSAKRAGRNRVHGESDLAALMPEAAVKP